MDSQSIESDLLVSIKIADQRDGGAVRRLVSDLITEFKWKTIILTFSLVIIISFSSRRA